MSAGEDFNGQNVNCLAIKRRFKQAKFAVGTHGLETYFTTLVNNVGPLGSDESSEKKISSGLKLLDIRAEVGGQTRINFTLEHPSPVQVNVYDVTGRLVHDQRGDFEAGRGTLVWDGRSRTGKPCASGIYFLRLSARDVKAHRKFLLIR